ncbi:MAG: aminopeptidase, partial [Eubacteriales bacterium]|nr:aminopeptidase [Eubacteriales bacterium]
MFDDNLEERYCLAMERICEIADDSGISNEQFNKFFLVSAAFIKNMNWLYENVKAKTMEDWSFEEQQELNSKLYEDVAGQAYDTSFANPVYAVRELGEEYGRILSFLYMEIRGMIVYAYEGRLADMTVLSELFIEIYCMFDGEAFPSERQIREAVYWYVSDYSDDFIEYRTRQLLDPSLSFAADIIINSDLNDLRYLYKYGEYITENEIETAKYLNSLPQEDINAMARTFTEGYRIGFELGNKPLKKKKTVNIRFCVGFERIVREEIRQFAEMGLKPTIYRAAVNTINKRMHLKIGYYSTSPNRQMDYDHRFDAALYTDSQFIERKLGALKLAYEKNRELAAVHGGPAVMEVFGENPFEPIDHDECCHFDERQQKLIVRYNSDSGAVVNNYIKGEERSYTIIAYPIPEIGDNYREIFSEIVKINTLDYEKYKVIQQNIIDVMDRAEYVQIKGGNGNETDLKVSIMPVKDPLKETVFENCLADVNIPLGEVFTSPVLKGTTGVLHVSSVYLNDLKFINLKLYFKDGYVVDYSCDNYSDKDKNRAFFRENVMMNHDRLPMGEFAIGTNTAAYVMANKYDIVYKLPILIVEKMGPHFAIGDTCYSHCEDVAVYNPN